MGAKFVLEGTLYCWNTSSIASKVHHLLFSLEVVLYLICMRCGIKLHPTWCTTHSNRQHSPTQNEFPVH